MRNRRTGVQENEDDVDRLAKTYTNINKHARIRTVLRKRYFCDTLWTGVFTQSNWVSVQIAHSWRLLPFVFVDLITRHRGWFIKAYLKVRLLMQISYGFRFSILTGSRRGARFFRGRRVILWRVGRIKLKTERTCFKCKNPNPKCYANFSTRLPKCLSFPPPRCFHSPPKTSPFILNNIIKPIHFCGSYITQASCLDWSILYITSRVSKQPFWFYFYFSFRIPIFIGGNALKRFFRNRSVTMRMLSSWLILTANQYTCPDIVKTYVHEINGLCNSRTIVHNH